MCDVAATSTTMSPGDNVTRNDVAALTSFVIVFAIVSSTFESSTEVSVDVASHETSTP